MITTKKIALGAALFLASTLVQAATTAENAAKLGTTLTPVGAEKAGNAAGTIPAWTGGLETSADRYTDPFASEKPLFIIDANNAEQYKDNLSPGQLAMFKKYPDTYKLPVYPSHRTSKLPQKVYDAAKANATNTTLSEDGNGVVNYVEAVPFPIPENGLEVIWNHLTRYRGGALERSFAQVPVKSNGAYTAVKITEKLSRPQYLNDTDGAEDKDNILLYFVQEVTAPARLTGNILLVHETLNQIIQPRQAWTYNSGQRRVRRAPQVAYDAPGTASDGQRTSDNSDLYNGAPDRYDWKLVGKQELYIPYNSYKLASRELKYDDVLKPGHINPDHTRYELHRVWKVEATLKEGERHIYDKRVFFIDEDSWQVAIVDHYDGRGELWRVGEAHHFQFRDVDVPLLTGEMLYDLQSGRYLAGSLTNEEGPGYDFTQTFKFSDFTPQAIRRQGR